MVPYRTLPMVPYRTLPMVPYSPSAGLVLVLD